ncbi:hypothetical protein PR002_g18730 [Phytophthora rubi]|uniref:Serine-threonine/tyrosine-protein kinase catalytic domain-containing protein n=1 Tax=Phytophthora rubi TaxID=129364 RepID=A0A6A3K1C3_9STRA|nr:hypothetical protein PR002_g18730 [Phytophthora rubi]
MRVSVLAAILAAGSATAQDYTITFRSLEETSSSYSHTNDSFVFDGSNSDIAQQLYILHQAGDFADALELNSIPAFVTKRLDPLRISFDDLPGLVQRALIWDSGFAISPDNDPVQIWTMENYTMASISVPQEDIAEVNCTVLECPQPNGEPAYSSQYCTGSQILNVSRCVADTFEDSGASGFLGVMWSTGGNANMTPHMRLRDHSWIEPTTGAAYELYAIHTVSNADDPTWNQCPANDGYSSLIIPCHKRSEFTDSEIAAMTKPVGSDWVTDWLTAEFAAKKPRFNKLLLIPIVLGSLVVVAVVGFAGFYLKRRAKRRKEQMPADYEDFSHYYVAGESYDAVTSPVMNTDPSFGVSSSSHYESVDSNQTFGILLRSPHLQGNRIPYDNLIFDLETDSSPPSNGSFVFDGTHSDIARQLFIRHQANDTRDRISLKFVPSALKTRLSTLNIDFDDLPGLVQRAVLWDTGFAIAPGNVPVQIWPMGGRTMANIAVKMHEVDGVDCDFTNCSQPNNVTAYYTRTCTGYQMGNTSHCVADVFEDKGARGYLGNMWARGGDPDVVPEIVMRDHTWTEDIAEFGGNTSFSVYVVHTIPSLKETPWSKCPKNGRYGTSDIYSFGVLLSELDTGRIPYHDALMEDGTKMKPFKVLHEVMSGSLRPSFSDECPPRIQRISSACLSPDPQSRPTAQELVQELEGKDGDSEKYEGGFI